MFRAFFSFLTLLCLAAAFPAPARAEAPKPDDRVIFDLSAEDWISTKTARLVVNVEAAVSSATAGNTRAAMTKALDDLVKAEWRLISFSRGQDQTGMERWSAMFEARVPENVLSGMNENAKKVSKPGMQLTVNTIDFSPTLDEMQAAQALLRSKIYKMATEQLAALNAAIPGRNYRIAMINFTTDAPEEMASGMPRVIRGMAHDKMAMMAQPEMTPVPVSEPMERSEKLMMTARVVLAVMPAPVVSTTSPSGVVGVQAR